MKVSRKWTRISLAGILGGLGFSFIGAIFDVSWWIIAPGFALVIAAIVISEIKCRCPHCGSRSVIRYLTWSDNGKDFFCAECGAKIEYDEDC